MVRKQENVFNKLDKPRLIKFLKSGMITESLCTRKETN